MTAPLLAARDLSFSYGRGADAPPVVDRVSMEIARGAVVGLLGPNGSGKTTLLRLLAGVLHPRSGSVLLDGAPIASTPRRALARRLAMVPQETRATFDFSVLEMVMMGRYPHLGPLALEGPDDLEIARAALRATGTAAFESRAFATLSGGEKQRVVIAGALAQASDALLLDEPTSALDLHYQLDIASLLRSLNRERGTTLVVSTHDLNLAASLCRHVVLLRSGRVLAQGPTADTLTSANIRALYNVDADVHVHERTGHVTVIPLATYD